MLKANGWTDQKTEELVGQLLRFGVTAAATIGVAHVGTSAISHIAAIFPSTI